MPRIAPRVPELSEILCSSCGYVLNGLPQSAVCPECGQPVELSLDANRVAPAWELAEPGSKTAGFLTTSLEIIIRPKQFYRTFTVRGPLGPSGRFATLHWWLASAVFGLAGATHAVWFYNHVASLPFAVPGGSVTQLLAIVIPLTIMTFCTLKLTTCVAARLTTWEATYRGYRLPYEIVLRGLYYHAAHYLPVAVTSMIMVDGYQLLLVFASDRLPYNSPTIYLYCLCGLVVISALYLFQTYWIGMRNMMYANR